MLVPTITPAPFPLNAVVHDWLVGEIKVFPASAKRFGFRMFVAPGVSRMILCKQGSQDYTLATPPEADGGSYEQVECAGRFYTVLPAPIDAEVVASLYDPEMLVQEITGNLETPPVDFPSMNPAIPGDPMTTIAEASVTPASLAADLNRLSMLSPDSTARKRKAKDVMADDETVILNATEDPEVIAARVAQEIISEEQSATPDEEPTASKPKKVRATVVPAGEKLLNKLLAKLGKTEVPPPEVMFAKQIAAGCKMVKISSLAVLNDMLTFNVATTELAKMMNSFANRFGESNILNRSAEVKPARVIEVAALLLQYGRLVQRIQVAHLTDIPEAVTRRYALDDVEFDQEVLQAWDGRHRICALVFLYGPDVEIPVECEEMTFLDAYHNCLVANACRDLGSTEKVHFAGLVAELTCESPEIAFRALKGSIAEVTKWVTYQCIIKGADSLFTTNTVTVGEIIPKGRTGMTTPAYTNVLKDAMSALGKKTFVELNEDTIGIINLIIETANEVFSDVNENHAEYGTNLWTSYGSRVIGRVIGEAIFKALAADTVYTPATHAKAIVKAVIGFVDGGKENVKNWNNLKASALYEQLHDYASSCGVNLPRVKIGGSVLKKK